MGEEGGQNREQKTENRKTKNRETENREQIKKRTFANIPFINKIPCIRLF